MGNARSRRELCPEAAADSHSLVLDENGWTQVRTGDGVDIYVFAYGNDYKEALNDFYRLTGKTPMLPRYALGNWWSRYYAYTEDSYKALVTRFGLAPGRGSGPKIWQRLDRIYLEQKVLSGSGAFYELAS